MCVRFRCVVKAMVSFKQRDSKGISCGKWITGSLFINRKVLARPGSTFCPTEKFVTQRGRVRHLCHLSDGGVEFPQDCFGSFYDVFFFFMGLPAPLRVLSSSLAVYFGSRGSRAKASDSSTASDFSKICLFVFCWPLQGCSGTTCCLNTDVGVTWFGFTVELEWQLGDLLVRVNSGTIGSERTAFERCLCLSRWMSQRKWAARTFKTLF